MTDDLQPMEGTNMNKYGESLGETKTHFKMYKKGRNWMVAGIAVTNFGLSAFGLGTQNAKAATAVADDSNSSVVYSVANTGNSATLKAGQADTTTADRATTTTVADATDTTASGTTTSMQSNETNQVSVANAGSTQTDSNDGAAGETVDASANDTTNNVAENEAFTASDEYQSVATTNVSDGNSASTTTTKADADSVQVTDLKTASDADFDSAKQAAAETYKTTGVAQKITRTAAAVKSDPANLKNLPSQFTIADAPTATDIADGTYGTSAWKITDDGTLSIGSGELTDNSTMNTNTYGSYNVSPWYQFKDQIKAISFDGDVVAAPNSQSLFAYLNEVTEVKNAANFDTSQVTNLSYIFNELGTATAGIQDLDLSSWNVSNVSNFWGTFYHTNAESIEVADWDVSNGTTFQNMFAGNQLIKSLDLSKWNVGKGVSFAGMFQFVTNLASLDVSNWDVSSGVKFSSMFSLTQSLTTLDVSKWNVGNGVDFSAMFDTDNALTQLDVSKWDVSKGVNFSSMFASLTGLSNIDVSNWNVSNGTNFSNMFGNMSGLTSLDVSKWDVAKGTDFSNMLSSLTNVTTLNLANWDTSHATTFKQMFGWDTNLMQIEFTNWNAANVTDFSNMFYDDEMPTLDLSGWQTMSNSTDSMNDKSPVYGMFTGLTAKKLILGQGFLINPVMPSSTQAMYRANDTTWIGVGTGTEVDPQGLLLVNTTYTGNSADADTYLLVGAYVNYVDVDTGSQLKQVILPATVTSYTATVPDGYVLATGQKRTFAIQAANKPTVYTVNVTTPKPALPDESQTMTNLTVKYVDSAGNELQSATVQSGQVGTNYMVSVPAIDGYTTTAKPISGQFKGNNMVLTLTYVKDGVIPDESANTTTMTSNYVDQNGNAIATPTTNAGKIGTDYTVTAPTIAGYQLADGQPATTTGKYSGNTMDLTLVYDKVAQPADGGDTGNGAGTTTDTGSGDGPSSTGTGTATTAPDTGTTSGTDSDTAVTTAPSDASTAVTADQPETATSTDDSAVVNDAPKDTQAVVASGDYQKLSDASATPASGSFKLAVTGRAEGTAAESATAKAETLPQTDETQSGLLGLIGVAMLGTLGVVGSKKRKVD